MTSRPERVIIVGAGIAGLACACVLAERGLGVTLLEARHAPGGRASSFEDPERPAEWLDNCQHVLLGCCTNLLDLYRRLGVSEKIAFHRRVHFLDAAGRRHDLWAVGKGSVPAPLHLGPAMALFSALSLGERVAVVRAMFGMLRMGKAGREKLEGQAFGEWLDSHRQPAGLLAKFYDPILVSALNEESRRASSKYAIQVFQEAMLANSRGYVVGLPACPLSELYENIPAGVELRVNQRVEEIVFSPHGDADSGGGLRASGVKIRQGEEMPADAVVIATNYHAAARWVANMPANGGGGRAADPRFAGLDKLESVPILGAHLWFDRPVMTEASAALIAGPLQWLFRKDAEGKNLHGVISAAREWVNVPKEDALGQFEKQIRGLFSRAKEAKLLRGVVVIEKRATFSPLPGADRFRPEQAPPPVSAGGIQRLILAGDYTKTDWPATMEGAARSGYLAAHAVLSALGISESQPAPALVPDLPVQWPARLMGMK